tara:strand:- start:6048 stop:7082 length:1035 start_codon:yes stop_codon:yes gene_type:complete
MISKEILNSHPVGTLKKEISKTNVKGYSKMKKAEVVELMMKHKDRFGHMAMKGKAKPAEKPAEAEKPKKKKLTKEEVKERVRTRKARNEKPAEKPAEKPKAKSPAKPKAKSPAKPNQTAGEKLTGLTTAQMNSMTPEQLFGLLPTRVASGVVLNPKRTGVKVAQDPFKAYEDEDRRLRAKQDQLKPKVAELKAKYIAEFNEKKLKVPELRKLMPLGDKSGYNKKQMIEILSKTKAEKDSGFRELTDKILVNRYKENRRQEKAKEDKIDKEIEEAKKNPTKPSIDEIRAFGRALAQHDAAMRLMRGPAYAESREKSKKRLLHKFRNIFSYRDKFGSSYINKHIAS